MKKIFNNIPSVCDMAETERSRTLAPRLRKALTIVIALLVNIGVATAQDAIKATRFISDNHAITAVASAHRYLLLPVEEKEDAAEIRVIAGNHCLKSLRVRLAVGKPDYLVPLDLQALGTKEPVLLDIIFPANRRSSGNIESFTCWKYMKESDSFDVTNKEKYRPAYHHTPAWGWMNDPNGMFYKDGVWHLYYQHNPYGSLWDNLSWGHSTSRDLVHWTFEGDPVEPDAWGTIFSGSSIVDHDGVAGYGKEAVVAYYTSAREGQTQSMAYSTDNGTTFTKYAGNPVITAKAPDFRDPHLFYAPDFKKYYVIVSCGQKMNIYSSDDLKTWTFESSFGEGYGCHEGVWECPDLMKMSNGKWVLVCNINPGGPFGGSATQYFVGNFDGHKFTCESNPEVTKWMDYGKDHYAAVTFDNAPDGRHVAIAWMSNWQYATQVPTQQYRSANSIPRDLGIFTDGGEDYVSVVPSPEMTAARGRRLASPSTKCEIVVSKLRDGATIVLSNGKGEKVTMKYSSKNKAFAMDRRTSGKVDFSDAFPCVTTAPTHGRINALRIFVDASSIEAFDADGKMAMTNLVFPTEPYNKLTVKGGKAVIYEIK
ncbi:2,6-beta-D-fructofuranosidase [Prevotella lacticifex]|uniref:2,6-beta-D-fructofuranosidase n=2 Tax=Prevotella lacticifex TaxID=2854755 RepID=A0A9R1C710_9BACT|nr:DUF4980 domain-containing protein [Prevotella lacticifex]GJG36938.1 2,6-beta-D-fructofuranosidase [Prevotella lacticifex]GJG40562.1 2,6-beta-D-fructofuranosidase [Prevotella lacticifex]GJG44258.1 2,6-beta-D-fructofuranosidase [Prevotella lacticifex]GJG46944.1 2,6-beta-D-fructofuranosidase [Prevotella lacticifex]GJG50435.1 2,6-beta-D-fructofuranosidase [Prevotella lacticifex]